MKVHRFFVEQVLTQGLFEVHNESLVHQLSRVLRVQEGDTIALFNGDGSDYLCTIEHFTKDSISVLCEQVNAVSVVRPYLTIGLAAVRKDRFEWALEKLTELGVACIVPLTTERTERGVVNSERAKKIILEAAEQCGRADIPVLHPESALRIFLDQHVDALVCHMDGEVSLELLETDPMTVLIGPEGGWSDSELMMFRDRHIKTISLGTHVLRAETAAVAVAVKLLL
jgi:16S rRNA (uracil1498-N3)-methyltransferase